LINHCITCMSYKRVGQIICLSVLFLPHYLMPSQVVLGRTGETVGVKVISNLIVMPGYVNDSAKLDVVLDTGASDNILMPDRSSELKLNSTSSGQVAGIGRGQDETMHISSGVRLAWGYDKRLRLDDQKIAALPIDYISNQTGHQVDGIFGSSLFQHFHIRVDYEHGEVTFASGSAGPTRGTAIPVKIYGGVPFVEAAFETATGEKVPALFLVDSGTASELILSRKFIDAHPSVAQPRFCESPTSRRRGRHHRTGCVAHYRSRAWTIPPYRSGGRHPAHRSGRFGKPQHRWIYRAGILSRFTVDWDYEGKTMTLTPNHRYGAPFEADASGLRLVAEKPDWKTTLVSAVTPGSPASGAGMEPGDI
jgi:hypothetical protein